MAQRKAMMVGFSAFEAGDIFVTATDLDNSARFPTGHGRVRQYDKNWAIKGEFVTGGFGLISSLLIDGSGTLHILDPQARRVDHVGPVTMPNLPAKPFGSVIELPDGTYLIAEHMVGQVPGFEGEGKVYRIDRDGSVSQTWNTETNGGMGGFLGVTHMALSPDRNTLYHVSETGPHIYAHDLVEDRRLGPIYTRQDPPPMVFGLACLPDGDLIVATGGGARRLSSKGALVRDYALPTGRGWSVIELRDDAETFWALDFFGGAVVMVDADNGTILFHKDLGLPKALAGIAEMPLAR